MATRSDRNSASSTSWVTISAVLRSSREHAEQHVLQLHARERVEHAEGLVEQQHLRREREGAGDAHALAHAGGELRRALVLGVREADEVEVVRGDVRRARRAADARRPGRRPGARCRARSARAAGRATGRRRRGRARARRSPGRATVTPPAVASTRPAAIESTVRLAAARVADDRARTRPRPASRSKSRTITCSPVRAGIALAERSRSRGARRVSMTSRRPAGGAAARAALRRARAEQELDDAARARP